MEQDIQQIQNIVDILNEFAVNYGFQVFGAIVILLIGWQVSRWVAKAVLKVCDRAGLDITLAKFFAGIAKTLIIIFVAIVAMDLPYSVVFSTGSVKRTVERNAKFVLMDFSLNIECPLTPT